MPYRMVSKQLSERMEKKPEEREIERKSAELAGLQAALAQRELDLATLRAELRSFEARYLDAVGKLYAQLDEIEAQVAEWEAALSPSDDLIQQCARRARAQATESAGTAGIAAGPKQITRFQATDTLKKLYRDIAKAIHPDLGGDNDRALRHLLMSEANQAFEHGDEPRLRAILREWSSSPESVEGVGVGPELVRIIRKIAQAEQRLLSIEGEINGVKSSELYALWVKTCEAEANGGDPLAHLADQLTVQIQDAKERLEKRRNG
jgi:hypothetical protein